MIDRSAGRLLTVTRDLVEAIRSDADHLVSGLVLQRSAELEKLSEALNGGAAISPSAVQELQRLDCELLDLATRRRDALRAELGAIHRGRRAGHAYTGQNGARPRYVDRAI